jgi:uncharacterized membrane protein required for colicin V production
VAGYFYKDLAEDVLLFIENETLARLVAFGVLFAATALAGQILALVLKPAVEFLQLGVFDQLVGAAFGFVKALVFIEAFLIVFVTYPKWDLDREIDDSLIGNILLDGTPFLVGMLPDEFELSIDAFNAGLPASLPGRDDPVEYQPPGNVPPSFQ